MELMACQDLAVSAEVMRHVVHVESNANPYAIGVVGERLVRQPRNLGEALATVRMLDAGHYGYSLGLAQVNRSNLHAYGLDSYREAFMPCPNVAAGARILADCYARSGGDWDKAFSCYYAGDFITGHRDGYVQKIRDSIGHDSIGHELISHDPISRGSTSHGSMGPDSIDHDPIDHDPTNHDGHGARKTRATTARSTVAATQASCGSGHPRPTATAAGQAYRAAIRSAASGTGTATLPGTGTATAPPAAQQVSAPPPGAPASDSAIVSTAYRPDAMTASPVQPMTMEAFVPRVRGPGAPSSQATATTPAPVFPPSVPHATGTDRAAVRKEPGDAAFVF